MIIVSSVVEGDGDVRALPNLIHRIAARECPQEVIVTPTPARLPRSKLRIAGQLERFVELAAGQVEDTGGVLLVFDADDDCAAHLGPELLDRATNARPDVPVGVVLACKEWEGWFLAAGTSIAGHRDLPTDLQAPGEPETIRDAKGWLSRKMPPGRSYRETVDQLALTRTFDLDQARAGSGSFDKCYREIVRLLASRRADA